LVKARRDERAAFEAVVEGAVPVEEVPVAEVSVPVAERVFSVPVPVPVPTKELVAVEVVTGKLAAVGELVLVLAPVTPVAVEPVLETVAPIEKPAVVA